MIVPDYRNFKRSNELYHYGMPRRSGRYPWGSGERPHQSVNSSNFSSDGKLKEIKKIYSSLSEKDKYFIGESPISEYTKYLDTKDGAYIVLDNYDGKFKDEHPYEGLIVSIAASPKARGTGATDKLIEEAKRKNSNDRLIAEIDSDNTNSRRLFERNGFKKMGSFSDIDVYYWDKNLNHSVKSKSEVNFKMNNIYYLSHGGPGSGRYPLGSGERPYQKFEKTRRGGIREYITRKKKEKEENKNLQEKRNQKKHTQDKERVLKSGTPKEVLAYKGELTRQELSDVYGRLNFERMIEQMSLSERITNEQRVDKIVSTIAKTTGWVADGVAAYNVMASLYNNVADDSKKLPVLKIQRK